MKQPQRYILLGLVGILLTTGVLGQELKCTVTVNSDKIQGSNKALFTTLQQSMTDFVNNTKWTNLVFQENERIECSMMLVVSSVQDNLITGELTCQSRRPVYGTAYTTPLLNVKDNLFNFTYQEYDRIEYQNAAFTSNLAALLVYYCYLIIGYDMDSYSRLGGTPYFRACEEVVTMAQSASLETAELTGWKAFESNRNRYAMVSNLTDEAFRKFREYIYEYHRFGLDEMVNNVANGRARIASGISVLRDANRARPATYIVNTFLDAKSDELVNIFREGTAAEKKTVYEVLTDIDPTRQSVYEAIAP